ncbi:MAG TPA: hypothetical protein DDZ51_04800 [Planctomycetaceae bacterium]|nr:hypothetical protein [Planctomycetaceae bacterium]
MNDSIESFRRLCRRRLGFDCLESRCMLAVGPLLWIGDNNLGLAGGIPDDFISRFEEPSSWEHTLRAIDTIYLTENSLRNVENGITDSVLQGTIAPVLNAHQVDVAINSGAATWLGYRAAMTGRTREQLLVGHFDYIERLQSLGLQVKHVSLQSVLSRRHRDHASWEDYPISDRIDDVAAYARLMRERFPEIRVGVIDALPTHGRDWRRIYSDLASKLESQQTSLSHVHLDAPVDLVGVSESSGYQLAWSELIQVQRFVQDDLGAKFGLLLTSTSGGATSAAQWRQDIFVRGMARYHEALGGDAAPQQQPDRIIVTAWHEEPRFSVPERLPNGTRADTLTGATVQISNFIRGNRGYSSNPLTDEVQQVFPISAVSSSIAAPEWNAGNAVFARGIVNASSVLERFQWKAAADDPSPWIVAQLPAALNLDRIRVWPLVHGGASEGVERMVVYVSDSGSGSPVDRTSSWHRVAESVVPAHSLDYVDLRFETISTRFVAVVLEGERTQRTRGLAALRLYSPNNNWNQNIGRIEIIPSNYPPYVQFHPAVHLSQSTSASPGVALNWAFQINAAPPFAPHNESAQSVRFEVLHEQPSVPISLFSRSPIVASNGVLTLFPAANAVGSTAIVIRATDHDNSPGFVSRSTLMTVSVHIHPVNDSPRLVPDQLGRGETFDADRAWEVTSQGIIRYTLREIGSHSTVGMNGNYFIPLRRLGGLSYDPIGLLDIFDTGRESEQGVGLGGQVLSLIDDFPRSTRLDGALTLGSQGGRPGVFYRPPRDINRLNGYDEFEFTVTDNGQSYLPGVDAFRLGSLVDDPKTIQGRVQLILNPVNSPPVFRGGSDVISGEGDGRSTFVRWARDVAAGPATALDEILGVPDAQPAIFPQELDFALNPVFAEWNTDFSDLFTVMPSLIIENGTATLGYETAPHANGVAVFDAMLIDSGPHNPSRGDINRSLPIRFTITVDPVNDPPQFIPGGEVLIGGSQAAYSALWATEVLPGPPAALDELAQQTVAFELIIPEQARHLFAVEGLPTLDSNGRLSFVPSAFAHGQASIGVVAVDSLGARSAPVELKITLVDNLDPPLAANGRVGTYRGDALEIDLLALVAPTVAGLDFESIEITSLPNKGELLAVHDGLFRYIAGTSSSGDDSFTYRISDVQGRLSNLATITIAVVTSPLQNPLRYGDVNNDGEVAPLDALMILNRIGHARREGVSGAIPAELFVDISPRHFYDIDANRFLEPLDALLVLNRISWENRQVAGEQAVAFSQEIRSLSSPENTDESKKSPQLLLMQRHDCHYEIPESKTSIIKLIDDFMENATGLASGKSNEWSCLIDESLHLLASEALAISTITDST